MLGAKPVAYFSAEFGIHESMPIYSGGLGVLSGDHIKSASGLGVPLVAIGLFYDQGYFKQHLDASGYQNEEYLDTKVANLPMKPALSPDGEPITVSIDTRDGTLLAKVWLMQVGRVKLYLLDCDVEGNSPQDRELTSRLYGGDERTRIRQELVLGVGGVRALARAGNHSGRVSLERRAQRLCHAGSDSPADAGRRFAVRRRAARSRPSTPSSRHTRPCPPVTTVSTARWSKSTWVRCATSCGISLRAADGTGASRAAERVASRSA